MYMSAYKVYNYTGNCSTLDCVVPEDIHTRAPRESFFLFEPLTGLLKLQFCFTFKFPLNNLASETPHPLESPAILLRVHGYEYFLGTRIKNYNAWEKERNYVRVVLEFFD